MTEPTVTDQEKTQWTPTADELAALAGLCGLKFPEYENECVWGAKGIEWQGEKWHPESNPAHSWRLQEALLNILYGDKAIHWCPQREHGEYMVYQWGWGRERRSFLGSTPAEALCKLALEILKGK